ncbi:outer membrane lipoprotein-sorting protein [Flavobacterium sp. 7A]|uniref:outer membrane lipoprotein-sorting protein n=1 Tax=Flavobacterium sp. 7A TaxID=2940571 RepID=UPI002227F002|nr:outer membrane lipoprotein-sorting protein [Flavobacterium sp. 7A]MCW2117997.1 hypothetical protein [Flavobacterium sp. 7A]
MKNTLGISMFCLVVLSGCNNLKSVADKQQVKVAAVEVPNFQNRGHELVYNMVQKVGNYNKLQQKKDVVYTYTYQTADGKKDVSTEKYSFDGEWSYGHMQQHERTLPDLAGTLEQGYDGSEYWIKHNGVVLTDPAIVKRAIFSRATNFYWFAMMQKVLDPGINYEYLGDKAINGNDYSVVKITFDSKDNKPKDIYQLYINRSTNLVDQFLFTVVDFGKTDPLLMKLEYEEVDGILIPTKRKYKGSNWEAVETNDPWTLVNWRNIKFGNQLTKADFTK